VASEGVEHKVRGIMAEQLGISEEEIARDSTFLEDLGADSLDIVELLMALEEEFSIEIPDEDAEKMRIVGDVIDYLDAKLAS
jgi:acyl carrier protein